MMLADSDYSAPLGIDKNEISKMLKSLQQMYQEHRQAGDPIGTEAEFTSYVILLKVRIRCVTGSRWALC